MENARILIVEDEHIVAEDLRDGLQSFGYDVIAVVSSGEEAVRKAREIRPDLVIMDIMLKGSMNGVEAAENIRALFDIPVIYLTAHSDSNTLDRAKITEPFGYILKPFEERELQTAIEMALYKHKTEKQLKENKHWVSTILKSIGDGVIAVDQTGSITFMNPIAELLTGWKQEDALGKDLAKIFHIIDEKTRTLADNPVIRVLREEGMVSLEDRILLIAKDGTEVPIDSTITPLKDDRGSITGVVLVFRDITRRKQAEESLQKAYDKLRQTQQAAMQQERLRAIGQMASGIAHDINNTLSPILTFTDLLLTNEPNLSERSIRHLQTIRTAGRDIAHTVARMREFYRPREEQEELYPVSLNQLVEQVIDLTRPRWKDIPQEHGITLELRTELDSSLPGVPGIESGIREALTNLILNAVDAMPLGGTITIRTYPEPQGMEEGPVTQAILEVLDTGHGMDEETRQHCLEPFFSTKGERGTGLGLSVVFGVMQRHEGQITLESDVGQGTLVRLIFPVYTMEQEGPHPEAPEGPEEKPRPLRILFIDDEPELREAMKEMLEIGGHEVEAADSGQAGIEAFHAAQERGTPFEVVITDLGMPYVDGREVARAVKRESPTTPVILLTGWGPSMQEEGDLASQVDHVLGKPPEMSELQRLLSQVKSLPAESSTL